MEDFIINALLIAAAFVVGLIYGWGLRERHAKRQVEHLFEELEEAAEQEVNESLININIERHSGMFYVFNKDTDEFMGQGKTRSELETALAKRYPNKRFTATTENLKVFNESV